MTKWLQGHDRAPHCGCLWNHVYRAEVCPLAPNFGLRKPPNMESIALLANLAETTPSNTGTWQQTLSTNDAGCGFGRLIDLARIEPLAVAKKAGP